MIIMALECDVVEVKSPFVGFTLLVPPPRRMRDGVRLTHI